MTFGFRSVMLKSIALPVIFGAASMRTLLALVTAVVFVVVASADDEGKAFKSGPQPSESLPGPFQPFVVVGKPKFKGRIHCPITENALNPVVGVFVRGTEPSEAIVSLIQKLDEAAAKNEVARLAAFAAFLADDVQEDENEPDKVKAAVQKVLKEDDQRETVAASLEDRFRDLKLTTIVFDWLGNVKPRYKLHDEAEVTVVIYEQNKVRSSHAFRREELTDDGVKSVMDDVAAQLKAIKDELAGRPKP